MGLFDSGRKHKDNTGRRAGHLQRGLAQPDHLHRRGGFRLEQEGSGGVSTAVNKSGFVPLTMESETNSLVWERSAISTTIRPGDTPCS
jgi:hypothetical protein